MKNAFTIYPENASLKIGFKQIREATAKKAFTPYGSEFIRMFEPSPDKQEVLKLLEQASEWSELLRVQSTHPLSNLEDIRDILIEARISGSSIALDHFIVVLQNARLPRIIKQYFDRLSDGYPAIHEIVNRLISLKPLEESISKAINDRGELKDDASPELKQIRNKINRERNHLRTTIQRVMRRVTKDGMTSDEGATIRNGRMVIPVLAEYKRKIEGFIHDVSSTGQTVYLEPVEALQINNEIRQLESEEQREIERIIRTLTSEVRKYTDSLYSNIEPITLLDAIHCRVKLGIDLNGSVPQISDDLKLELIEAKNPNLLLKNILEKSTEPVIPLHLNLNQAELGLVITGPNAGGKSVAMKTAGLLQMMVQSGYPIPANPESNLPVISGLFVDMGDDQSIENDLSTFSSRLSWMRHTLKIIEPGALILIDEAGSGTDPEEGGALFQSFVEEVIAQGCRVIITTHHGSLKVFAHEKEGVINGAMEFNQENLTPTYRFKKGIPGSSYAFEIADRMELPKELMQRARTLLGDKRDKMGDLLISLEKSLQEAEEAAIDFRMRLKKLEKREREWKEQTENLDQKKRKILEKAYKDAEEIMSGANRRIEEAVEKVVNEGRENKEIIREARNEIKESKSEIKRQKVLAEKRQKNRESAAKKLPVIGDYVLIDDSQASGELIELSGNRATVLMNGMRIKAKIEKLTRTSRPRKKDKKQFASSYSMSPDLDLSIKPNLDLRGKRGEDAIRDLTLYIDKAITRGLNQVEIIHGKGEGILLKLVHEYLENRKEIKSFEIAPWESGGSGCTIVQL
ncbi:MAG: endonuclease MutS2 [Balneolaceae bacterium]